MKKVIFCLCLLASTLLFSVSCQQDNTNKSNEAKILTFILDSKAVEPAAISETGGITFLVKEGTALEDYKIKPIITVSPNATVSPASGIEQNFAKLSIFYVVTAEDGKTKTTYTVIAIPVEKPKILTFKIGDTEGVINEETRTIKLEVPADVNLKNLIPEIGLSPCATIEPASRTKQDFSGNKKVKYVVKSKYGETTKEYTVTATNQAAQPI